MKIEIKISIERKFEFDLLYAFKLIIIFMDICKNVIKIYSIKYKLKHVRVCSLCEHILIPSLLLNKFKHIKCYSI